LKPYLLKKQIKKSLVILDQARCHLTADFKSNLAEIGCEYEYIPPSLTSNIVGWFKKLKLSYKKDYSKYYN
jgi:hypothetical protein